jgi:uncharacterized membrane protein
MVSALLAVLFRWLHLATAAVAVGGVFYARIVVPIALRGGLGDDPAVRPVVLRARRVFKIVTHSCILFLLVSGTYNATLNWAVYTRMGPGVGHSLFGMHLLLGLTALGLLLWQMIKAEPPADHLTWMGVVLGLMLLTIAFGSVLKYGREHAPPATVLVRPGSGFEPTDSLRGFHLAAPSDLPPTTLAPSTGKAP